ncbi:zinc finger CCCH domain-containing protein 53-like isoform X2 [Durio zibethinus]|uniref:Zinc finger CCCH domain-containing protein 53-like isoform X2 n=1 Tax=Durio zibethinus TaxID=66656 RepID=A0A6P5Z452_DURZI|nr:zinc finger CCCH domain-containing protein 53-like isoform X2 [Durio zibethinus]
MDGYEATRVVFSRIQNLEPENASKIMGLLLIQDHGEKEMIRLAFGPEALLHSVILKAKKELGLPTNSPSTPSTPLSPSPFLANNPNPVNISRQSSSASRLLGNGGVNLPSSLTIPTNSSTSPGSSSWSALSDLPNPDVLISPSSGSLNPSPLHFYGNGGATDMIDEFQLQDPLSFLNESSPQLNPENHDLFYPQAADLSSSSAAAAACGSTDAIGFSSYWGSSFHRRSSSVSDILGADDPTSGFGWRPCLYFARGYCKNGNSCRFIHGALGESGSVVAGTDDATLVGSPNKIEMMDQCHEFLRSKSAQQQRLAAASQFVASASFPYSPKCMNLFLQQQQNDSQRAAAAAALVMGDDMNKFNRSRLERNGFSINSETGMLNPASRQIYLTFPADSTFREEDVSNYFRIYGPVQDVRIPFQQKRMFGFVTFVYPETVKIILAKGNPHFVCDARVLVKPYKEKGKVPDKKQQQQQVERGEFSPCGTPTGLDSRDPFDLQLGARMFYNTHDMFWRRNLEEQADLQQALELQNRRFMGLQLLDVKKHHHHRALSSGSSIPSPTPSPNLFSQSLVLPKFHITQEAPQENCSSPLPAVSTTALEKQATSTATAAGKESVSAEENGSGKESPHCEDGDLPESLGHNLPDSPFASPTKASGKYLSAFSNAEADKDASVLASSVNNNWVSSTLLPANNALDMASFNSFNCQMPRFSSGHGTIGMYAGTGGPTCPVGI